MSGVETHDGDSDHSARIVHTELEPVVVPEIGIKSLESTAIILLVEMSIINLSNRVSSDVGLPVDIRSFDNPSVMRGGEVDRGVGAHVCITNIVARHPPIVSVDR